MKLSVRPADLPDPYTLLSCCAHCRPRLEEPEFVWAPGNPREISRLYSASRDTPILEKSSNGTENDYVGVEFGVASLKLDPATFRFGVYGMVHIEDVPHFWRGLEGAVARALRRSNLPPR